MTTDRNQNCDIFHVATYCSVDGTNVQKEPSAFTLIVKHFTPKTETADFSESCVAGYHNGMRLHIPEGCDLILR